MWRYATDFNDKLEDNYTFNILELAMMHYNYTPNVTDRATARDVVSSENILGTSLTDSQYDGHQNLRTDMLIGIINVGYSE